MFFSTAVLREARPLHNTKSTTDECKDPPMVVAGSSALAHAVGSGSVTVSLTGSVPSVLKIPEVVKIPEPLIVPMGGGVQEVSSSLPGKEALSNLKDITVTQAKR